MRTINSSKLNMRSPNPKNGALPPTMVSHRKVLPDSKTDLTPAINKEETVDFISGLSRNLLA